MCPMDQTRWMERISDSCDECLPCLDEAKKKVLDRAKAQKAALAEGMTLAEAVPGSQVVVDNVKGTAKFKKDLAQEGLDNGVIVAIETRDTDSGSMDVNIKGYHLSLTKGDASKILVKPI